MWFSCHVSILVLCSLLGAQAVSLSDLTDFGFSILDSLPLTDFGAGEALYTTILNFVGLYNCNFHKDVEYDLSQLQLYHYSFDVDGVVTTIYNVSNGAGPLFRSMGADAANYSYTIYIPGFNSGPGGALAPAFQAMNDSKMIYLALDHLQYTSIGILPLVDYDNAVTHTYHIGKQMGEYLSDLVNYGVPVKNIHVVGHSLGAHITGFAASYFQNLTNLSLARITGLDPARPCFSDQPMENVIDDSDADYVDIIHCNAGGLGWTNNYASADFYPNGGASQPACKGHKIFLYYNYGISFCSHNICPTYFALSLLEQLEGRRCNTFRNYTSGNCGENPTAVTGRRFNATSNGTYYLTLE